LSAMAIAVAPNVMYRTPAQKSFGCLMNVICPPPGSRPRLRSRVAG
jgi:hypothetical protein